MINAAHPFTAEQTREHRRLRKGSRRLAGRLARTITPRALEGTLAALGQPVGTDIVRAGGAFVVADCCVHEWRDGGRTLVRAFAESPAARRLTGDERRLLDLWQDARLALLRVDEVWPGVGFRVRDAIEDRDLAILDGVLSQPPIDGFWLVARVFPVGGYWMTTPAVTLLGPLDDAALAKMLAGLRAMHERGDPRIALALGMLALTVHSAPATGEEEGRGEEEGAPHAYPDAELFDAVLGDAKPPPARAPGRNEPCPCGSGRKYKKCCAPAAPASGGGAAGPSILGRDRAAPNEW